MDIPTGMDIMGIPTDMDTMAIIWERGKPKLIHLLEHQEDFLMPGNDCKTLFVCLFVFVGPGF